jgi:hypothetical protein
MSSIIHQQMWITFLFCGKVIDISLDVISPPGYITFGC